MFLAAWRWRGGWPQIQACPKVFRLVGCDGHICMACALAPVHLLPCICHSFLYLPIHCRQQKNSLATNVHPILCCNTLSWCWVLRVVLAAWQSGYRRVKNPTSLGWLFGTNCLPKLMHLSFLSIPMRSGKTVLEPVQTSTPIPIHHLTISPSQHPIFVLKLEFEWQLPQAAWLTSNPTCLRCHGNITDQCTCSYAFILPFQPQQQKEEPRSTPYSIATLTRPALALKFEWDHQVN